MFDFDKIAAAFIQFGPIGLMVFYLIQRETAERKDRLEIAKADITSREKLTSVLTALHIAITGKPYT